MITAINCPREECAHGTDFTLDYDSRHRRWKCWRGNHVITVDELRKKRSIDCVYRDERSDANVCHNKKCDKRWFNVCYQTCTKCVHRVPIIESNCSLLAITSSGRRVTWKRRLLDGGRELEGVEEERRAVGDGGA